MAHVHYWVKQGWIDRGKILLESCSGCGGIRTSDVLDGKERCRIFGEEAKILLMNMETKWEEVFK